MGIFTVLERSPTMMPFMALLAKRTEVIVAMRPSFGYWNFVVNVEGTVPGAAILTRRSISQDSFTPFVPIRRVGEPVVV